MFKKIATFALTIFTASCSPVNEFADEYKPRSISVWGAVTTQGMKPHEVYMAWFNASRDIAKTIDVAELADSPTFINNAKTLRANAKDRVKVADDGLVYYQTASKDLHMALTNLEDGEYYHKGDNVLLTDYILESNLTCRFTASAPECAIVPLDTNRPRDVRNPSEYFSNLPYISNTILLILIVNEPYSVACDNNICLFTEDGVVIGRIQKSFNDWYRQSGCKRRKSDKALVCDF